MFALATIYAVLLVYLPRRHVPVAVRLLLMVAALVLAAAVSAAMVAIGAHHFTDAAAGAAVGTGLVLTVTLMLDLVMSRARQIPRAAIFPWRVTSGGAARSPSSFFGGEDAVPGERKSWPQANARV